MDRWTDREVVILVRELKKNTKVKDIQKNYLSDRTLVAVSDKCFRIQEKRNRRIEECVKLYNQGVPISEIAKKTKKSIKAVESAIYRLCDANRKPRK